MSAVQIVKEALPSFMAGNGTVGTTPAQLTAQPFEVLKHIVIKADAANGSTIQVAHASAATANGFILAAGQDTPPIYVNDTSKVWLVGGAADQAFNWIAS